MIKKLSITTPAEHRALLVSAMENLVEGKMNVGQANALATLSGEVHKSIRNEWEMRLYVAENLTIDQARVVKVIAAPEDNYE